MGGEKRKVGELEERGRVWKESQSGWGLGTGLKNSKERKQRHIELIGWEKCYRKRGVDFSRSGEVAGWI